jgi:V8-like Glu-specific endopeptidase
VAKFFNRVGILLLLILMLGTTIVVVAVGSRVAIDTSSKNASAIIDGREEKGYPSAAYMLTRSQLGRLRECGAAIIEGNRAVSAAHCVEPGVDAFIGVDRADATRNLVSTAITIHPAWASAQISNNDLVVISLADVRQTEVAKIGSPRIGCDYVIVGYGEDQNGINGLRKSADVCIDRVNEYDMELHGADGTACFGDSGSPVFRKGTNEVVAVISQIVTTADAPCSRNDTIRATRLDSNLNKVFSPNITIATSNLDQPVSLDLRLASQEYLGNNTYKVSVNAEIVNNTKDSLGKVSIDWCTNNGELKGLISQFAFYSSVLQPREGYASDDNCQILQSQSTIAPFSRAAFNVTFNVHWEQASPFPIDMLVSGIVGDNYRVFALSNNRDLPQLIPNSSTLLISLEKPLFAEDNLKILFTIGVVALVIVLVIFAISRLTISKRNPASTI